MYILLQTLCRSMLYNTSLHSENSSQTLKRCRVRVYTADIADKLMNSDSCPAWQRDILVEADVKNSLQIKAWPARLCSLRFLSCLFP